MSELHELDGAYVLGALSTDDRRAFEEHLATCPRCTASVGELAGVPGLLSLVDRDEAVALLEAEPQADAGIVTKLADAEWRLRRRNRLVTVLGIAAAAAVVALMAIVGPRLVPAAEESPKAMEQVADGVMTAELSVHEEGWGTRFDWSCDYASAVSDYGVPQTYVLVAIDERGVEHVVASWQATSAERAGGLTASSSVPYDAIRAVEIRYEGSADALVRTEL